MRGVIIIPQHKNNNNNKMEKKKEKKQAGAELCQAQFKLGLPKIEIFFHLIEN
jgi:hypothetical protein